MRTSTGMKFDINKPARSNMFMILDDNGRQIMDTLKLTGRTQTETEFMQPVTLVEVAHSFGTDFVQEDLIWQ
jgi:hypothetical protein